jgi:hypothetical protein
MYFSIVGSTYGLHIERNFHGMYGGSMTKYMVYVFMVLRTRILLYRHLHHQKLKSFWNKLSKEREFASLVLFHHHTPVFFESR